jgi:hypothetical protein
MKKLKIVFLFIFLLLISLAIFLKTRPPSADNPLSSYPKCPTNLSGILTAPLIELKNITSITPLGNISPPGHTSPADHNYFTADTNDKVPVYAPSDGWITNLVVILAKDDKTGKYVDRGITLDIEICKGLILTFANLTEAGSILKNNWPKNDNGCKYDINKVGHDYTQGQCYFHTNIKVKAGDLIGYTQNEFKKDGTKQGFAFEIWAANYNRTPPGNIDWSFYDDDRYAHIMCTFDLYSGSLKKQFYDKLGGVDQKNYISSSFTKRTIEPICGTVNQNIVGTIQGMWFGQGWKNRKDKTQVDDIRQFSFLHWNIDPVYAEIGNAGEITKGEYGQLQFLAKHSGTIDREPSEVTADGRVYCYNFLGGKILTQLIDDRHLKLEHKPGSCEASEAFTNPFSYER